jgi:uncharacterized protein YprB with RNaseH-like and TPR domain
VSSLADRIRAIVGTPGPKGPGPHNESPRNESPRDESPFNESPFNESPRHESRIPNPESLSVLGGELRGNVLVVERRLPPLTRHGRELVGTLAECLDESSGEAALYAGGEPASPPFVFFDLETTGLSGGAGTQAFLVGCGWFERDASFATRQFLLTRYSDERPMLDTVAAELAGAGTLVTYNGKSFDTPMLETRYLFHRLSWNGRALPHVDVLHPARRFWKRGSQGARAFQTSDCSLTTLERQVLGVRRSGDVPGIEIPRRYFQFIRSGDTRPLTAVLEHNRIDLLSLAALLARLLHLARVGPDAARDAREALALGYVFARAGLALRACDAFGRAVEMTERGAVSHLIRIESLRALALAHRRARQYDAAAACWRRLVGTPGCPPRVLREAAEALAIHHEHRDRDLGTAKDLALQCLELGSEPVWVNATRHRLARLDRKMSSESLKLEV